jgi:hypothetical protein
LLEPLARGKAFSRIKLRRRMRPECDSGSLTPGKGGAGMFGIETVRLAHSIEGRKDDPGRYLLT